MLGGRQSPKVDFVETCGTGFLCAIGPEGLHLKGPVEQEIPIGTKASCQFWVKNPLFPGRIARGLRMPLVFSPGVLFALG